MDCLDSHESLLFFFQSSISKQFTCHCHFPLCLAILCIPLFSLCCLFCLQAALSCISPVSQSALSSRDDALRPLYHICLVDYHCFLFTGWCRLVNPLPSLHTLHSPPYFFPCVHSSFSLLQTLLIFLFLPPFPLNAVTFLRPAYTMMKPV